MAAWRRKQALATTTPTRFEDLVDTVVAFADPLLERAASGCHLHAFDAIADPAHLRHDELTDRLPVD